MTSGDHERHTLAGAYVLDAVSDDERTAFETHLADCAECREETRELREATARLGTSAAVRPRPELRWPTIQAACRISQLAPVIAGKGPADAGGKRTGPAPARRATSRMVALPRLAIAAAVIVIAGTTGAVVVLHNAMQELHHSQRQDHLIAAVLNAPDAVMRTARISTGGMAIVVMSHREHMGVFTAHDLRALPATKSYELWLMGPRGDRPIGVLRRQAGGMAGPAVLSGMAAGDMIGLTIEPASGSSRPTSPPVVLIGPLTLIGPKG